MAALVQGPRRVPEWIDRLRPPPHDRPSWIPPSGWTDAAWLAVNPDQVVRSMLGWIDWEEPGARDWLEELRSPVQRAGLSELLFGTAHPDYPSGWRRETGYAGFRPRWRPPVVDFGDVMTRLAVTRWLGWVRTRYDLPEAPDVDRSVSYWLGAIGRRIHVVVASSERTLGAANMRLDTGTLRPSWGQLDPATRNELCGDDRGSDPHVRMTIAYSDRPGRLRLDRHPLM
jgi:hypothetical protein